MITHDNPVKEALYSIMENKVSILRNQLINEIMVSPDVQVKYKNRKQLYNIIYDILIKPYKPTQSLLYQDFICEGKSIRWRRPDEGKKSVINYETPEKEKSRQFVFSSIKNKLNPVVVLNANEHGYDVNIVKELNNSAIIHNIESDKKTLSTYLENGYDTINHRMTILDFFKSDYPNTDILYLDCYSYYCGTMEETLKIINNNCNVKEICITLRHLKNPRGNTNWDVRFKYKYGKFDDAQKRAIDDVLTNYTFIGKMEYESSMDSSNRSMVVLKYQQDNYWFESNVISRLLLDLNSEEDKNLLWEFNWLYNWWLADGVSPSIFKTKQSFEFRTMWGSSVFYDLIRKLHSKRRKITGNKKTKYTLDGCVKLWKDNNIKNKGEFKEKFPKEYIYLSSKKKLEDFYKEIGFFFKTNKNHNGKSCSCGKKRAPKNSKCYICLKKESDDKFKNILQLWKDKNIQSKTEFFTNYSLEYSYLTKKKLLAKFFSILEEQGYDMSRKKQTKRKTT